MKEYAYNLFGLHEFHAQSTSRLRFWYDFIRNNLNVDGDIFEFGVYRGASLIPVAIILKELGSNKKVYGFDSFSGFPSYSKYDDLECFYRFRGKYFSDDFISEYEKFLGIKRQTTGQNKFDPVSIATSGAFNNTSKEAIIQMVDYFQLDNVILIEGDFAQTVPEFFSTNKVKISSANIDCDLYEGYRVTLPFVFDNLSPGGFVNLDEYYSFKYPGAKIACDDFFAERNISPLKNQEREGEFERWYLTKAKI